MEKAHEGEVSPGCRQAREQDLGRQTVFPSWGRRGERVAMLLNKGVSHLMKTEFRIMNFKTYSASG